MLPIWNIMLLYYSIQVQKISHFLFILSNIFLQFLDKIALNAPSDIKETLMQLYTHKSGDNIQGQQLLYFECQQMFN